MRIIGGKYRGKILKEFDGKDIRPTSDRAREALFNILQFSISGKDFYDAFCGSGAVGIEAISRNAKSVIFTDINPQSVKLTKSNLSLIGETATVLNTDATEFLNNTSRKFDIVFIDPPYSSEKGIEVLNIISKRKLLNLDGVAIYEHKSGVNPPIDGLIIEKTKKYGIAEFTFYRLEK